MAALELEPEATQGLLRAGLKTISDMATRPMAAIAARFGGETVQALRHLLGETSRPITPRIKPTPILAERRFAEPVARTEYALEVLGELAAEAVRQLEQVGAGGRRFEAAFFRSDGLVRALAIETGQPTRDRALMVRLFEERIEGLPIRSIPASVSISCALAVPVVEPLAAAQLELEGGASEGMRRSPR